MVERGMFPHACVTGGAETGSLRVQCQPRLQSEALPEKNKNTENMNIFLVYKAYLN